MKKLEYDAFFFDGLSANKNTARVIIISDGLLIKSENMDELLWPYEELRQNEEVYSDAQTHLVNQNHPNQKLIVDEPHFLSVVKKIFPTLRFYDPPRLLTLRRIAVTGVLLILFLIPFSYFVLIPAFSEKVAKKIPISFEERLSKPYLSMLVPKESLCNSDKEYKKIEEIFNRLTATIPESEYDFKLYIIKSDIVNAFALPGGHIVLYSGLIRHTDRPEQIAGVLAHEIQHITMRHGTESLVRDYSLGVLLSLLTNDTRTVEQTVGIAKYLGLMNYSRENETEADQGGMNMLKDARVDPDGMVEFFEILGKQTGDVPGSLKYFSTHPQTEDRISKLKEMSRGMDYQPVSIYSKKEWEEIKKVCSGILTREFSPWGIN